MAKNLNYFFIFLVAVFSLGLLVAPVQANDILNAIFDSPFNNFSLGNEGSLDIAAGVVPLPGAALLLGAGLARLVSFARKQRQG